MKKSEALELAIISVIDNNSLEAADMFEALDVLFDERRIAKWSEAREEN